jgi:hypothetical protein
MRAVEVGIRLMSDELEIEFAFPKELADWQNLIEKIESEVRRIQRVRPKARKRMKI